MNDQDLDIIIPIPFKDALLIPITAKVLKLFENEAVKFQIKIKNDKIIIESPDIAVLSFHDNIEPSKAVNVT